MLTIPPTGPVPDGELHIGDVAALTGLSLRSIRHYEDLGLVAPVSRTTGGFRVYDADAVESLRLVMALKLTGLALDQIRPVVDACRAGASNAMDVEPRVLADAADHVGRVLDELVARIEPTRALYERLTEAAQRDALNQNRNVQP